MDHPSQQGPEPLPLDALTRLAGLEIDAGQAAALYPQVQRFYELAYRLRQLDLTGIEPATVFRVPKD